MYGVYAIAGSACRSYVCLGGLCTAQIAGTDLNGTYVGGRILI